METTSIEFYTIDDKIIACLNVGRDRATIQKVLSFVKNNIEIGKDKKSFFSGFVFNFNNHIDRISSFLPDLDGFLKVLPPSLPIYAIETSHKGYDVLQGKISIKDNMDDVLASFEHSVEKKITTPISNHQSLPQTLGGATPHEVSKKEDRPSWDYSFVDTFEETLVMSFKESIQMTFDIQCGIGTVLKEIFLKTPKRKMVYDIAASIGLLGKVANGAIALGFREAVFLEVMNKMLGEKSASITSVMEDGCGELLNITFGQTKKMLSDKGLQFGKTLPTVFIGSSLRLRQLTPHSSIILEFESDVGPFHLELGYKKV